MMFSVLSTSTQSLLHHVVRYKRKNDIRPFENETSLEFFSQKSDASLFTFGCHTKKRPHTLIFGRLYDFHILDMIELGIDRFRSLESFKVAKISAGTKPCLLFAGEQFENELEYQRLKSLLTDFFRGPIVLQIRLQGLEYVLMFTVIDGKVLMRSYRVILKKSGCKIPRVELEEIGPSFDFIMKRTKLASENLYALSRKTPMTVKPKTKKNKSIDSLGTKFGRIHMERQDYKKLQTLKLKGLKQKKTPEGFTSQNNDSQPVES